MFYDMDACKLQLDIINRMPVFFIVLYTESSKVGWLCSSQCFLSRLETWDWIWELRETHWLTGRMVSAFFYR